MPTFSDVEADAEAICDLLNEALEDGKLSRGEGWELISGPLLGLFWKVRSLTEDKSVRKALWVDAVEHIYEHSWVPYNIPGVGPMVEMLIDQGGKAVVRPAVSAIYDFAESLADWLIASLGGFLTPPGE